MYKLTRRQFLACSTTAGLMATTFDYLLFAAEPSEEVPWLGEVQQYHGMEKLTAAKISPPLLEVEGKRITTQAQWKDRREKIRNAWLMYLGALSPNPKTPKLKILKEDRPNGVIRQHVEYEGEPGIRVQGYLLRPERIDGKARGVLVMHSTTTDTIRQPAGVQGEASKAFGLTLARQGCVAFCPECFLWHDQGERSYVQQVERFHARHPRSKGMAKMLFDAQRGLDVLESLAEVDANRLGAIGHSLGAKEALYVAAFDPRVKATVSSEGGIGTTFSNWNAPWYLDKQISGFGREHHELLALAAPNPFLLVGGNSADGDQSWPYIDAARGVYELFGKPTRLGLLNHKQGHSVPPAAYKKMEQWLLTYL